VTTITAPPLQTAPLPPPPAAAPAQDRGLRVARRVSWAVFGLQFLAVAAWSAVLYSRFALTRDATTYLQGLYLISHGTLDPYSSVVAHPLWQDHFSVGWWPVSLIDLVPPHGLMVLWAQDAALVAAEVVAFRWIVKVVDDVRLRATARWWPTALGAAGLLILVANPWTYWSLSWDLHTEIFACPFIVAAALDFSQARYRRGWIWVILTLAWGDVSATWVAGLGLSALLVAALDTEKRKVLLRHGGSLIGAGVVWLALIALIGGNKGSTLAAGYGYLAVPKGAMPPAKLSLVGLIKAMLEHPGRVAGSLWHHRLNVFANLAPTGVVGIFTPWTIGVPLVVLLANNLSALGGQVYSVPGFQSAPIYLFGSVGFIILVVWLVTGSPYRRLVDNRTAPVPMPNGHQPVVVSAAGALNDQVAAPPPPPRMPTAIRRPVARWRPYAAATVTAVVVAMAVFWASIWIPPIKSSWLRITSAQAATLAQVQREIPQGDELLISQGVAGRFADRPNVLDVLNGADFPVFGKTVWFVVAPNVGIETLPVDASMGLIYQLAGPMHAVPVVYANGIWAFRWTRPPSVRSVGISDAPPTISAWSSVGPAGVAELAGPAADWRVSSNGREGYVVSGDYWVRPLGTYEVGVSLSTSSPVDVEVWDDNANVPLARQDLVPSQGEHEVLLPVDVSTDYAATGGYHGWGPFRIRAVPPPTGQVLEIRVWSPSGATVSVYSLTLLRRNMSS